MYPYSEDERANDDSETALNRMVEDRLYWQEWDPEFRGYVDNSFKSVYGNGPAEADATGRTVVPAPRAVALPPFRPSVTPEDTALAGPVGEGQPNAWRDVLKVQKGLAKTDHYAFDMAKERSGEHSPALGRAIREFQREKKEEIDGLLLPGGPTITRLRESLFGDNAGRGTGPAENSVGGSAAVLEESLPTRSRNRSAPEEGREAELIPVQSSTPRPRQAPRRAGDESAAKRFTLPTEQLPYDPKTWGQRAVIVTMPDGRAFILRNPLPRDRRSGDGSDFQLSPGTAVHRMPIDMARARFESAIPMSRAEADAARERASRGQQRYGDEPYQARIPMRPQDNGKVYIRHYLPNGRTVETLARNGRTGEALYATGDERVVIAAEDAVKLGLVDWMPIPPPAPSVAPPVPTFTKLRDPVGWAQYAVELWEFVKDHSVHGPRAPYFAPAPEDAERTWR